MPYTYTSKTLCGALCGLLLAVASGVATADTVTLRDGKTIADVTVIGVDAKAVTCSDREPIPLATVATVTRDAFAVPAMASGVSLRDGTTLCGTLRLFKSGTLHLRSVSAGMVPIPLAQLAAIRYRRVAELPLPDKPDAGAAATVLRRDGSRVSGQLMWADAESIGLLNDSGLERLSSDDLIGVVLAPVPSRAAVVLRNGDRFATITETAGETVTVDVAGTKLPLRVTAILNLHLHPTTKE